MDFSVERGKEFQQVDAFDDIIGPQGLQASSSAAAAAMCPPPAVTVAIKTRMIQTRP